MIVYCLKYYSYTINSKQKFKKSCLELYLNLGPLVFGSDRSDI